VAVRTILLDASNAVTSMFVSTRYRTFPVIDV